MTADIAYAPIHVLMSRVMADIGAVSKSDYNQHQKFNFRGIDSLQNACYGPMCKHGVFVVPEVIEAHYAAVKTSGGKDSQQATLRIRFTFYGPAGDSVSAITQGESMDSADKATNKAMAAAFKYALLQSFCIPTEGQDDADHSAPERASAPVPSPAPKVEVDLTAVRAAIGKAMQAGVPVDEQELIKFASNSQAHADNAVKALEKKIAEAGEVPF